MNDNRYDRTGERLDGEGSAQKRRAPLPRGQYPGARREAGQRAPQDRRAQAPGSQGYYTNSQRTQGQYSQDQRTQGQYRDVRQRSQYPRDQRPRHVQRPRSEWQHPQGQRSYSDYGGERYDRAQRQRAATSDRTAEKKKSRSTFRARLLLFLAMFLVLGGLVFAVARCAFYSTPDDDSSSMKMTYGKETFKVDESAAYHGGELYVSFTKLADYLDLSFTGDANSARYVFAADGKAAEGDGEEYVEFYRDEARATVSGSQIALTSQVYFSGDEVLVPASFVRNYMDGVTLDVDASAKKVTIARTLTDETDDDGKQIEAQVTLKVKSPVAPAALDAENEKEAPPTVTFTSDLADYEKYMAPSDDSDYLILVNKTNTVGPELKPDDLIDVANTRQDGRATQQMRECAAKALEALFIEMSAEGYSDVTVTSAYRSYEYQDQLYSSYVAQEMAAGVSKEQAEQIVDTYSARPGTSEHQTGLCCDMHNIASADQSFAYQPAYAWLKENAWKFGFIERFPQGKEEVTGYSFEPWHYRFVGRRAAAKIHERGITLEEYLGKKDSESAQTDTQAADPSGQTPIQP